MISEASLAEPVMEEGITLDLLQSPDYACSKVVDGRGWKSPAPFLEVGRMVVGPFERVIWCHCGTSLTGELFETFAS